MATEICSDAIMVIKQNKEKLIKKPFVFKFFCLMFGKKITLKVQGRQKIMHAKKLFVASEGNLW